MTLASDGLNNAKVYKYTYADATARLAASGFVPADVGVLALQLDTAILYMLTDDSPATWQAVTPTALPPSGSAGGVLGGTYPNPSFADDMATQAELDTAVAALQPLDSDLTAIAALSPSNDDVIQRKAGAWSNRTVAQLVADLIAAGSFTEGVQDVIGAMVAAAGGSYNDGAGTITLPGVGAGSGSVTTVQEVDGSPSDAATTTIRFPNGTLAIASHVATYTPGRKYFRLPRGWRDVWDAAAAAAGSTPARVAIIGDSFLMGQGSSNYQTKGSQALISAALQALYGNGADYFGITESVDFNAAYAGTPPFVKGAGLTFNYDDHGLLRAGFVNATVAGTYYTFVTPYACTDIDLLFFRYNTTAGTWVYTVDGGADQTVTMSGYTQGKVGRIALTGLANTTHTIVFKATSAANVLGLNGVITYRSKTSGVHVARGGWAGAKLAHMFDTSLISPNSQADATKYVRSQLWRANTNVTMDTQFPALPHLAIIGLGLNDATAAIAYGNCVSYAARLVRALRRGRADCSVVFLIHNYPDSENTDSNDPGGGVTTYVSTVANAIQHAAQELNCATINLLAKWGETPFADGWQGSSDFHPTDAGHQDISDMVMAALAA